MLSRHSVPVAPRCPERPQRFEHFGHTWEDPFAWLRDPSYPDVEDREIRAWLERENTYLQKALAPFDAFQEGLFSELCRRVPPEDHSVPLVDGPFVYQHRYSEGSEFWTLWRWPVAGSEREGEIVLDVPALAATHSYYQVGGVALSPDHRRLAVSADSDGSERYRITVLDLDTGAVLDDTIGGCQGTIVWDRAGAGYFFIELDDALRPSLLRYRALDEAPGHSVVIHAETDARFWLGCHASSDDAYLIFGSEDKSSSEWFALPLAAPEAAPVRILPRRPLHEYSVDHINDAFWVLSNRARPDFSLWRVPARAVSAGDEAHWQEVYTPAGGATLEDVVAFRSQFAFFERHQGAPRLILWCPDTDVRREVTLPERACALDAGPNVDIDAEHLRIHYASLVSSPRVYDVDLASGVLVLRQQRAVGGGYDRDAYTSERFTARAKDGTEIPISLVMRRDLTQPAPLLLYVYGAYGISIDPTFSASRLSLLDRGFAYAIAHVRGGAELGRHWYEAGKLEAKENTFSDTITCIHALIERNVTAAGRVFLYGGSAGGMTVGAVLNRVPELLGGAIAAVPFVDCTHTMLDSSLPLTPTEYTEWGNPSADADVFARIRGYSPYDNTEPRPYPPLLVTAGLNDPRVTYWEPAKWVAALRNALAAYHGLEPMETPHGPGWAWQSHVPPVLLHIEMSAGHRGSAGRFEALREVALEYTFLLAAAGLLEAGASGLSGAVKKDYK